MFPDYNTLLVTIMAIVIGLIVLFWHEKISGYFSGAIKPDDQEFNSKVDQVLFIASIVIVAVFALWLLRILGE